MNEKCLAISSEVVVDVGVAIVPWLVLDVGLLLEPQEEVEVDDWVEPEKGVGFGDVRVGWEPVLVVAVKVIK